MTRKRQIQVQFRVCIKAVVSYEYYSMVSGLIRIYFFFFFTQRVKLSSCFLGNVSFYMSAVESFLRTFDGEIWLVLISGNTIGYRVCSKKVAQIESDVEDHSYSRKEVDQLFRCDIISVHPVSYETRVCVARFNCILLTWTAIVDTVELISLIVLDVAQRLASSFSSSLN